MRDTGLGEVKMPYEGREVVIFIDVQISINQTRGRGITTSEAVDYGDGRHRALATERNDVAGSARVTGN